MPSDQKVPDKKVLHVGCGEKTIAHLPAFFQDGSWREVRFDIDPNVAPDIIGSITDMAAIETGSVDALFSSHNIEHLYPHEVPAAFREFERVLAPNGFALITCPDLQAIAVLVAQDKLLEPAYQSPAGPITPLDMMFGLGVAVANGYHFMAHRGGFTRSSLAGALAKSGFRRVVAHRRPHFFDLWALAVKHTISDEHLSQAAKRLFPA